MRPSPTRPAAADPTPVALRSRDSLRVGLATAFAAAVGFAPAIVIASPASAAIADFSFVDATVTVTEGGAFKFDVRRAGGNAVSLSEETLTWSIVAGTATAADLVSPAATGTLVFPADAAPSVAQTKSFTVQSKSDLLDEPNEQFTVRITDSDNAAKTATAVITDDDATPTYTLSVDGSTVDEGDDVTVTATLSARSGRDVTIPVSTKEGTALEDQDFTPIADGAEIVIPAGELSAELAVPIEIADDDLYEEAVQTFTVEGGTDSSVSGTDDVSVNIADGDEQPEIAISPATADDEGDDLDFHVTLSGKSERKVTVKVSTQDGPGDLTAEEPRGIAKAGEDYTAVTGATVTFEPEDEDETLTVETLADDIDELPEELTVKLSEPTVAKLGEDATTSGLISDSDVSPTVTLTPSKVKEGSSGTTKQTFTVKLSRASGQPIAIDYNAVGDSASVGTDFMASKGTLKFAPGETVKTFAVDIIGDTIDEGTAESMNLVLSVSAGAATGDAIDDPTAVEITDDDNAPSYSVAPVSMQEGSGGSVALFTVKLSNPSKHAISFDVTSQDGTATDHGVSIVPGENDYDAPGDANGADDGKMTIPAGQTNGYVFFLVNGDDVFEANEQMRIGVDVHSNSEAYVTGTSLKEAALTLVNDDDAPTLTVQSVSGTEGEKVPITGVVKGVAQADIEFSMTYAGGSVNGSDAAESDDFVSPGPVEVTIEGGTPSGSIIDIGEDPLELKDDKVGEPSETIVVSGTGFGRPGWINNGVVTILDNDDYKPAVAPTLTVPPYRQGVGSLDLTGKAGANVDVELWAAPYSEGSLAKVATTKADAQGNYTFTRSFTTMGYRFQTMASGLKSPERKVWLRHDPVLVATSPSKGAITMKVTGDPKLAGLTVVFQWLNPATKEWEKIDPAGTTSPSGLAIKNITGLKSGSEYLLRGYIVGNESMGLQGGYTGIRRVTVM